MIVFFFFTKYKNQRNQAKSRILGNLYLLPYAWRQTRLEITDTQGDALPVSRVTESHVDNRSFKAQDPPMDFHGTEEEKFIEMI